MPRPRHTEPSDVTVKPSYWEKFLESQGLVGPVSEAIEAQQQGTRETINKKIPVNLTPDQWTFCYRVSERLSGAIDPFMDHAARLRIMKVREQTIEELKGMFIGKKNMEDWFDDTRQKFNKMDYELIEIMYESLEGLKSNETKELKEQLKGVRNQLIKMRTIGPTG